MPDFDPYGRMSPEQRAIREDFNARGAERLRQYREQQPVDRRTGISHDPEITRQLDEQRRRNLEQYPDIRDRPDSRYWTPAEIEAARNERPTVPQMLGETFDPRPIAQAIGKSFEPIGRFLDPRPLARSIYETGQQIYNSPYGDNRSAQDYTDPARRAQIATDPQRIDELANTVGGAGLATRRVVRGQNNYDRNQPYLAPGDHTYNTQLNEKDEGAFRQWLSDNKVPFDTEAPVTDYDMRGFWKDQQEGHPAAKMETADDGRMHFSDYYKTPYHDTFSSHSQWADSDNQNTPRWEGDQYVRPDETTTPALTTPQPQYDNYYGSY